MSGFVWYMIIINIISFGASAVNYKIFSKKYNSKIADIVKVICNVLSIIGGALGAIIAYIVWGRRRGKENLAFLVYSVIWFVLQLILFFVLIGPKGPENREWLNRFYNDHKFICIYALIINIVTLAVFIADKIKAMTGGWRIRETHLFALAFIGGALGGIIGMQIANHKVSRQHFLVGIPMMFAIHILIIACFGYNFF